MMMIQFSNNDSICRFSTRAGEVYYVSNILKYVNITLSETEMPV